MAYGTIKVDTITFTDAGVDKSITVSGLVQNPTFSGNLTVSGTISGNAIQGQTISGATITGGAAAFTTVTGGVATITSGVFALGSASNPSISFTGDANTGLYSPGADQVAISTAGSGRLFVDGNGYIYGTASALSGDSLNTNGIGFFGGVVKQQSTAGFDFTQFYTSSGQAGPDAAIFIPASNTFGVKTNGSERLRITSAGLVGVGTSSPSNTLHVVGTGRFINGSNPLIIATDGGDPYIYTESAAGLKLGTNSAVRMTINSSGNVGVGTTSPVGQLSCASDFVFGNQASTGSGGTGRIVATGGEVYIQAGLAATSGSNAPIVFTGYGGVGERVRIDSSGRVGIGTSSPVATNHIRGSGTSGQVTASWLLENASSGTAGMDITGAAGSSIWRFLYGGGPSTGTNALTPALTIGVEGSAAGRVGIGTTSPQAALTVGGSSRFEFNNTNNYIDAYTSNYYIYSLRNDGNNLVIESAFAGNIIFKTDSDGTGSSPGSAPERARIDPSGRLLVGTSTARSNFSAVDTPQFQVEGNTFNSSTISVTSASSLGGGNIELAGTGTSTVGNTGTVSNNGYLGSIHFLGGDGTNLRKGAAIDCQVDGTPGANDMPGRIVLSTTAAGASSPTERLRIAQNGVITIQNGAVAVIGTLTDGATITPDFAADCNFTVTLGGSRTIANPTNITAGQSGSIFIVQDATGSRTLSWGSYWDFPGGTAPTLSTAANAVDRVDYIVRSSTSIHTVFTANYS